MDAVLASVGEFFMGRSPLHAAAEGIARRLREAGIDYAIAGALSLGAYGLTRPAPTRGGLCPSVSG